MELGNKSFQLKQPRPQKTSMVYICLYLDINCYVADKWPTVYIYYHSG